jgi:capsid protein
MDFEQLIKFFSPKWAAERLAYLKTLELQEKQKPQQTRADRRIQASGYQAAITGRTTSPYTRSESLTGIPSLDLPTQRNIRDRARQQCRDNPIAASMLSVAADNIVGNGFRHQAQSADDNWNKLADAAFAEWTTTADYKGLSWGQHQTIVVKSFMRDGDVAIAKLTKGQVQIIESDYLSTDPRDV